MLACMHAGVYTPELNAKQSALLQGIQASGLQCLRAGLAAAAPTDKIKHKYGRSRQNAILVSVKQ